MAHNTKLISVVIPVYFQENGLVELYTRLTSVLSTLTRFEGKTDYSIAKLVRFAFNGVTSFSDRPLMVGGQIGLEVTLTSFIFLLLFVWMKIFTPQYTTVVIIIFLSGIQLSYLGIFGQYIGRILREVRGRPLYVIDEKCGPKKDL